MLSKRTITSEEERAVVASLTWMRSEHVASYAAEVYWTASGTGFDLHVEHNWPVNSSRAGEPVIRIQPTMGPPEFDENGRWRGLWCKEDVDRWLAWDAARRLGDA